MSDKIQLNPEQIMMDRIAERLGLVQYSNIITRVSQCDVSKDESFQRMFNGYYLVRRNAQWRTGYYELFEKMKTSQPTFQSILSELFNMSGNIEASFASKMLATLDTCQPIWDQFVLKRLHMKLKGNGKQNMLQNAIKLYDDIVDWHKNYLLSDESAACLAVFNRFLPGYTWISDTKKLDFFLWSSRMTASEQDKFS